MLHQTVVTMLDTPPEIINKILKHAGQSSIFVLSLVNKSYRNFICVCYVNIGIDFILNDAVRPSLNNTKNLCNEYVIRSLYLEHVGLMSESARASFYDDLAKYGRLELIIWCDKLVHFVNLVMLKKLAHFGRMDVIHELQGGLFGWKARGQSRINYRDCMKLNKRARLTIRYLLS